MRMPRLAAQASATAPMYSGPLSQRITRGLPRHSMILSFPVERMPIRAAELHVLAARVRVPGVCSTGASNGSTTDSAAMLRRIGPFTSAGDFRGCAAPTCAERRARFPGGASRAATWPSGAATGRRQTPLTRAYGMDHQDSDFVVRPFHADVGRKDGAFVTQVVRLAPRGPRDQKTSNCTLILERCEQSYAGTIVVLDQALPEQ